MRLQAQSTVRLSSFTKASRSLLLRPQHELIGAKDTYRGLLPLFSFIHSFSRQFAPVEMCRHYVHRHIGPCPCPWHRRDHDDDPIGVTIEHDYACVQPNGEEIRFFVATCAYVGPPIETDPPTGFTDLRGDEKRYRRLFDFCDDCQEVYPEYYRLYEETCEEPYEVIEREVPEWVPEEPVEYEEGYWEVDKLAREAGYDDFVYDPNYEDKQQMKKSHAERLRDRTPTPEGEQKMQLGPFVGCPRFRYEKSMRNQLREEKEERRNWEEKQLREKHNLFYLCSENAPMAKVEYEQLPAEPVDEDNFQTSDEEYDHWQCVMQDNVFRHDKHANFNGDWGKLLSRSVPARPHIGCSTSQTLSRLSSPGQWHSLCSSIVWLPGTGFDG